MLYATVQVSLDAQHHYDVIASREITRDDFDVLSGIASVRKQCGWVEPTKVAA